MKLIDADAIQWELVDVGYIPVITKEEIDELPTVDAVPVRHGKWLWVDGVRCSQCNYKLAITGLPSYCPNCGARMDAERKDNE